MNPDMAPAGHASDGCFKVPRVTHKDYPALLLEICEKNEVGMVATIDTELLLLGVSLITTKKSAYAYKEDTHEIQDRHVRLLNTYLAAKFFC